MRQLLDSNCLMIPVNCSFLIDIKRTLSLARATASNIDFSQTACNKRTMEFTTSLTSATNSFKLIHNLISLCNDSCNINEFIKVNVS